MISAMEWLGDHEFHTQKPELEEFLSRAQAQTSDGWYGPTLVFSRTLREQEPLLPDRHVLEIRFRDKIRKRYDGISWDTRWIDANVEEEESLVKGQRQGSFSEQSRGRGTAWLTNCGILDYSKVD
jgi:hypothetical protein